MQRAIESLALRVATGMVRSGPGLLDAVELTQGFHQLRLKIPTLVTVDFLGYPVALEPLVDQHLGHCPCLLVARRYGLGELRENIGENKNIFSPITSSLKLREVDCQDFKGTAGKQMTRSGVERWCMAHRAPLAAADVVSDFSVHGGPVDTMPQQLHGSLITLVAHIVMERRQDIRPKWAEKNQLLESTPPLVSLPTMEYPLL